MYIRHLITIQYIEIHHRHESNELAVVVRVPFPEIGCAKTPSTIGGSDDSETFEIEIEASHPPGVPLLHERVFLVEFGTPCVDLFLLFVGTERESIVSTGPSDGLHRCHLIALVL